MKKFFKFLLDCVEIYIPMATFGCLFGAFIIQIFFRYILKYPLMWPEELSILAFIWTTLLAAGYVRRINGHVGFTLLYEKLSERNKTITRIISNVLIFFAFLLPVYPTFNYIKAMHVEKSSVLRIPFSIGYGPVLVFFILILGHSLYDIIDDFRSLKE
jgi:TRAP-type C4-dicarboxylate transport system permease small subunit